MEKRNAETATNAQTEGADIDGNTWVAIRQAGDTGILYGSVSSRDVAELIGEPVKRSMVVLEQPIKALGLHDVRIKLHPEVSINVIINVARTEDEAERQAAGEDVIASQLDSDKEDAASDSAERAETAKAMFEGDHGDAAAKDLLEAETETEAEADVGAEAETKAETED